MTTLFKTEAVIFDMDGVLVDSEPVWDHCEQQILADYGLDLNAIQKKYSLVTTGIPINEVIELYSQIFPEKRLDTVTVTREIVDRVIDRVVALKPIMPGVIDALTLCHSLGFKVGLASSSPMRLIQAVIESLNITRYFDACVSAEGLDYGKPNPAVYLLAAKKLGKDRLKCVTIEDTVAGMIATKAARMRSIVIPDKTNFNNPHWCLADIKLRSLSALNAQHLI